MLGVKYPSQMYMEGHMGNYINTTFFLHKTVIFKLQTAYYPIRRGQASVQVQVQWVVLQQICQTLMNKLSGMNSMMISRRVNANAPTLERSPRFASTFVSDFMVMLNALTVTTFLS